MPTELERRNELTRKINLLSAGDIQKLSIFLSGLEAGRTMGSAASTAGEEAPDAGRNKTG